MSWTNIKALKEQRAKAFADATALRDLAVKENRDFSTEEETRHATLIGEVENYAKRIEREEKAAAIGETFNTRSIGREDTANSAGMPNKDFRRYSLLRAIQRRVNNQPLDGIEAEVSQEIANRSGKAPTGFYVPMEAAYSHRVLTTSTGTGGVGITLESDYIELLRNAMVLNSLGSTIMAGMTGKFSIPRQSGGATAYWLGESGSPTASNQTLDQVAFVPKTVGAYTDISRQFINQTSLDAENFVKSDLTKVIAIAIDTAGLVGTGSSNQPTGITNTSGINTVSHGTNGGAETWADVVSYETQVLASNVSPTAKLSYVGNSKVSGALKQLDKTTGGFGQFVLGPDGKVNNYNFAVTNSLPANGTKGSGSSLSTMIYGNFADLVVAFWNGLDLMVDPYTGSSSGTVRIVALQDVNVEVRHPLSFSVATDIIA